MQHQNNFRSNSNSTNNNNAQQPQQSPLNRINQPVPQPIIKKGYIGINQPISSLGSSFKPKVSGMIPTSFNMGLSKQSQSIRPLQKPQLQLQQPPQQQQKQPPLQLPLPQETTTSSNNMTNGNHHINNASHSTNNNNNNNNNNSNIFDNHTDNHQNFFVQTPSRNISPSFTSQSLFPPQQHQQPPPQQQNIQNIQLQNQFPTTNNIVNNRAPIGMRSKQLPSLLSKPSVNTYKPPISKQPPPLYQQKQQSISVSNPIEELPDISFDIDIEISGLDTSDSNNDIPLPPPQQQQPIATGTKNINKNNIINQLPPQLPQQQQHEYQSPPPPPQLQPQPSFEQQQQINNLQKQQREFEKTINQLKLDLERKEKELKDSQLNNLQTTDQLNKIKEQQQLQVPIIATKESITTTTTTTNAKIKEKRKLENDTLESDSKKKLKSTTTTSTTTTANTTINNKVAKPPPPIPKEKIIMDQIMEDLSLLNPYEKPFKSTHNLGLQAITKQKAQMNKQLSHVLRLLSFKNGQLPSIFYLLPSQFTNAYNFPSSANTFLSNSTPLLLNGINTAASTTTTTSNVILPPLKQQLTPQPNSASKMVGVATMANQTTTNNNNKQLPQQPQQRQTIVNKTPSSTNQKGSTIPSTIQRSKSSSEIIVIPPQFIEDLSICLSNVLSHQRPNTSLFKKLLPFLKLTSALPVEKALDVILTLLTSSVDNVDFIISSLQSIKTYQSSCSQPTSTLVSQVPAAIQANNNNSPSQNNNDNTTINQPQILTLSNNQTITLYPITNLQSNPRIFSLSSQQQQQQQQPPQKKDKTTKSTATTINKEKENKELQIIALSNSTTTSSINNNENSKNNNNSKISKDEEADLSILKYLIDNFNVLCNLNSNSNYNNKITDLTLKILLLITDRIIITQPTNHNNQLRNNNNHNYHNNNNKTVSILEKFENLFDQVNVNYMFSSQSTIDQKILYVELAYNLVVEPELMLLLIGSVSVGASFENSFVCKATTALGFPPSNSLSQQGRYKDKAMKLKIVKFLSKAVTIEKSIDTLFRDIIFQAGVMLVYHEFNNELDLNLYKETPEQKQNTTLLRETLRMIYVWCNKFTEEISLNYSEKEFELLKATTLRISKYSHIISLRESIMLSERLVEFLETCNLNLNNTNFGNTSTTLTGQTNIGNISIDTTTSSSSGGNNNNSAGDNNILNFNTK